MTDPSKFPVSALDFHIRVSQNLNKEIDAKLHEFGTMCGRILKYVKRKY